MLAVFHCRWEAVRTGAEHTEVFITIRSQSQVVVVGRLCLDNDFLSTLKSAVSMHIAHQRHANLAHVGAFEHDGQT